MPKPRFYNINVSEMIRVDHAGEYGAKRIYQGQIKFVKNKEDKKILMQMLEHEEEHLEYFENTIQERGIRPTILLPLWHHTGYFLGAASSALGINSAMLLTQNVEEVIEDHYKSQITSLRGPATAEEDKLASDIQSFMDDEILHKNLATNYNINPTKMQCIASFLIKKFCKTAIALSKKI